MDTRIKSVVFNEEEHKYHYNGKELKGVTGAIGKILGKSFPDTDTVKIATLYGSDVHKEVENFFNNNGVLSTEGGKWVVEELNDFAMEHCEINSKMTQCEVMVSDFEGTASKVDVVMHNGIGGVYLFDIKTTSHFDREYCSLQLSVYKRLYEKCYGEEVLGLFVLGTKSRRVFRILQKEDKWVDKILNMNKGGN